MARAEVSNEYRRIFISLMKEKKSKSTNSALNDADSTYLLLLKCRPENYPK